MTIAHSPVSTPALKPTATISTPLMNAPMLGMKASKPVMMPSSSAMGTPAIHSSSQVSAPSNSIPASRPASSRRMVVAMRLMVTANSARLPTGTIH